MNIDRNNPFLKVDDKQPYTEFVREQVKAMSIGDSKLMSVGEKGTADFRTTLRHLSRNESFGFKTLQDEKGGLWVLKIAVDPITKKTIKTNRDELYSLMVKYRIGADKVGLIIDKKESTVKSYLSKTGADIKIAHLELLKFKLGEKRAEEIKHVNISK